ncbi:MAG: PLP-dependent aminotransferase family protein [Lachnospiraceae bacterium]|nr:PLP-dependent aminotransferase family protein [Lachnospiraceae bacterium]
MKNHTQKYLKLYKTLRNEITSGALPYGRKLPSKRALAETYGLSLVTVEHSLELLEWEGYVKSRERSGTFAAYRAEEFFRADGSAAEELPEAFSAGEAAGAAAESPDTHQIEPFPYSTLSAVMRRVLSEKADQILEKTPNEGLFAFRKAISEYLMRNRGIRVKPEAIWIGSGAEYLYGLIVEAVGEGRVFGIEDPSYEKIRQVYERKGVRIESLKLGRDGIESQALKASKADVLHISPYRSFPSGVTASASKKQEYLSWAGSGGRLIVEDDFESEFSLLRKPEDTVFGLSGGRSVIYLNTFSRTVSPALRVGYMVLPEDLLPAFREKTGFYSCTVPAFEQYVLTELLDSGAFERHLNRIRRKLRQTV